MMGFDFESNYGLNIVSRKNFPRSYKSNAAQLQRFEKKEAQLAENQELMERGLRLIYDKLESVPGYLRQQRERGGVFNHLWEFALEGMVSQKYNWFKFSDIVKIEFNTKTEKSIISIHSMDLPKVGASNCKYDFAVSWYLKFLELSMVMYKKNDVINELRQDLQEIVR